MAIYSYAVWSTQVQAQEERLKDLKTTTEASIAALQEESERGDRDIRLDVIDRLNVIQEDARVSRAEIHHIKDLLLDMSRSKR